MDPTIRRCTTGPPEPVEGAVLRLFIVVLIKRLDSNFPQISDVEEIAATRREEEARNVGMTEAPLEVATP